MSGPSSSQNSQSSSAPWPVAQPYLKKGYEMAEQNILNRPITPPTAPQTTLANAFQQARAVTGDPFTNAVQNLGTQLFTNPVQTQVFQGLANQVVPTVDSFAAQNGRFGSPTHAAMMQQGLTTALAPQMSQFGNIAQPLSQQAYQDVNALRQLGGFIEEKNLQEQLEPQARTQAYLNAIQGMPNYGSTVTSGRVSQSDPMGTVMQVAGLGLRTKGL